MGEVGKVELGGKEQSRSKANVPGTLKELWPKQADGTRTSEQKEEATKYQNTIRDTVKKDLLSMKADTGETLLADEKKLVETSVTARSGDTIGALAFAVDSAAISKARKATREARKKNPKAPEAPKDMALNWKSSVSYRDADGTKLVSCRLYEARYLGPKDVVSFEGGDKTKVVVTVNNEKSLKKVKAYAEKVKAKTEALKTKFKAYTEKLSSEYKVTITVEEFTTDTRTIDGLKKALNSLPVVEKALAQLKKKKEEKNADPADIKAYNNLVAIHLTEKDEETNGDTIFLGLNGRLNPKKVAEYLKSKAAKIVIAPGAADDKTEADEPDDKTEADEPDDKTEAEPDDKPEAKTEVDKLEAELSNKSAISSQAEAQ